jgi:DNA-binding MarR family transcriptional regulator
MSDRELTESVRALLRRHARSHHDLIVLLALCHGAGRSLPGERLAADLALPTADVVRALDELVARGLATFDNSEETPSYRIRAASLPEEDVRVLRAAYDRQPAAVIRQVNLNAIGRVRAGAVRAFGDRASGPSEDRRRED